MSAAKAVSANFSPLIINTVAGNGTAGYTGDGGPATSAEFYGPVGVAVDASGNLYIADSGNCRVRKVTASTRIVSTVAGNGTCGYSGDGGPATNAEVYYPFGLAVDTAGNIYIADSNNNRVRKVTVATGIISTVAGNGTWGYSGDGGLATGATLAGVRDVAVDAAGNIYIGDGSHRVRKVTASTGIISTVAGNGTSGYSGDGGPATSAMLANVNGVAVDSAGNVYVADGYNQRIRKVTASTGIISTVAGSGPGGSDTGGSDSGGYSGDGGLATAAQLNFPADVAVDSAGNIYIADFWNFVVRKVVASTGIIYTASGNGMQGYSGDGGPAIAAEESSLISVAVDRLGNFYIAESAEMRVRAVTP
jgi:sugar lactone lactonase YvrE